MATIVTAEGIPAPRGARKKPAKLVRGRRLHALVKAIHFLEVLAHQDDAENVRSSVRNYSPFLVLGTTNSNVMKSYNALLKALRDAKAAKA